MSHPPDRSPLSLPSSGAQSAGQSQQHLRGLGAQGLPKCVKWFSIVAGGAGRDSATCHTSHWHPAGTVLGQDTAQVVLGAPGENVRRIHGASLQGLRPQCCGGAGAGQEAQTRVIGPRPGTAWIYSLGDRDAPSRTVARTGTSSCSFLAAALWMPSGCREGTVISQQCRAGNNRQEGEPGMVSSFGRGCCNQAATARGGRSQLPLHPDSKLIKRAS